MQEFRIVKRVVIIACAAAMLCGAPIWAGPSDSTAKAVTIRVDTAAIPSAAAPIDTSKKAPYPPIAPVKTLQGKTPTDTTKAKPKGLVDTVYYGADGGYIDYDVVNKQLKLIGNAVIKYQDITLNADSINYFLDDGLLIASGKPQLVEKRDTTVGESMIYNIKTKRGRVKYATAHMDDAYFNGNKIVKAENNDLYIEEGNYTTCAFVDTPDYYFYGKTVKVIPNNEVVSKPVVFALNDAPVAWLPFFIFPLERNKKSGLLTPIWGGRPESGGYLDNLGYYFTPNEYFDVAAWAKVQEFNDFVWNASSRYALKYWLSGSLTAQYANASTFLSKSQQWSLDYTHNQNITPDGNTTLSGRGSMVGTNNFYTTYSEDPTQVLNQNLNANMSLSQRIPAINGSANLTWNRSQNLSNGQVIEDLPNINFSLPSRAIIPYVPKENISDKDKDKDEEAWYNKIFYSYQAGGLLRNYTAPGDTGGSYQKKAISQSFTLSSPQTLFKYFTVNPSFSGMISTFDSYMDSTTTGTKPETLYTYDTLTRLQLATKNQTYIDSPFLIYNPNTLLNDTVFKAIESTTVVQKPQHQQSLPNTWHSDYSWNAGISLSTNLYGIFPIHIFNFAGLRHTFTPSISYTYTPSHSDFGRIYTPIEPYAPDKPLPSKSVGININNEFQGKILDNPLTPGDKPVEKKVQLLTAALSTSYDFEAPNRRFGDLSLSANTGYEIVRVGYNSTFWMYDQNNNLSLPLLHQYSVSISPSNSLSMHGFLWEGDKICADSLQPKFDLHYLHVGPQQWQAGISPSYTFSQSRNSALDPFITTKQYSLSTSASVNFTRNWSLSWSSTYNFVTNQFVDHNVHFHYDQECWEMMFDWRPSGYNPGYYFLINVKKIPEIKWEQRE